jgi:acetyl esterase/lipase
MHIKKWIALLLLTTTAVPVLACAQPDIKMTPISAPAETGAIPLGTGGIANMPAESWFEDRGQRVVRNVSRATLTPVLPAPGKATGAAVIVMPGGGFTQLSMDNEGWPEAQWLADHGIAAFVLKYRLEPTPVKLDDFKQVVLAKIADAMAGKYTLTIPPAALEDATEAMRYVRGHAQEFSIDPSRTGVLGFSAGAMTALSLTLSASDSDMPAFVAPIYGPMTSVTVPKAAPPIFIVVASDDPLFGNQGLGLAESWKLAAKPTELHVYQTGGHGFGMGAQDTTTVGWINGFYLWLDTNHFLKTRP